MRLASLFNRAAPAPPSLEFRVREREQEQEHEGHARPDIVLFMTDEQRHDELGYTSGGHFETPVLDALAARGTIFQTAYSSSTVCIPSRTSLLTGLSHHRVPIRSGSLALRPGYWTVARELRAAGYQTALVGKMHFFPMHAAHGFDDVRLSEHLVPFSGYERGEIDDYHRFLIWQGRADAAATHLFGPEDAALEQEYTDQLSAVKFPYDKSLHPIGWIADQTIDVLRKRRKDSPLFLVVSFPRPHAPYDPAEPYASLYDLRDARISPDGFGVNEGLPEAFLEAFTRTDRQRHSPLLLSRIPEQTTRRILTHVRALVRQIDDAVGDVLAELDVEKTVTFFTADHGTYGGHRGLVGKVPWIPFDDLARVPFFCVAPDGVPGRRIEDPVQSHDFALTCLDYAGIEPPAGVFDAESLRSVLRGGPSRPDRAVFSCASMGWPMVRRGPMKLVRRGKLNDHDELLFNLVLDPGEKQSVRTDPSYWGVLLELRALLDEYVSRGVPALPDVGDAP